MRGFNLKVKYVDRNEWNKNRSWQRKLSNPREEDRQGYCLIVKPVRIESSEQFKKIFQSRRSELDYLFIPGLFIPGLPIPRKVTVSEARDLFNFEGNNPDFYVRTFDLALECGKIVVGYKPRGTFPLIVKISSHYSTRLPCDDFTLVKENRKPSLTLVSFSINRECFGAYGFQPELTQEVGNKERLLGTLDSRLLES